MAAPFPTKTFITRCKEEKLDAPFAGELDAAKARKLLELANSAVAGDAKLVKEAAAALIWGRAHVNSPELWDGLDDQSKSTLSSLYPTAKGSATASEMTKARRAVRIFTSPTSSPVKFKGVVTANDAAIDASKALAGKGPAPNGGADPGKKDAEVQRAKFGLDRDGDTGENMDAPSKDGGSSTKSPAHKDKKPRKLPFSDVGKGRPVKPEPDPALRVINFVLDRAALASKVPHGHLNALDLTHDWTDARRTAHQKAVTAGTARVRTLAHQIDFMGMMDARKTFAELGMALAHGGRWDLDSERADAPRDSARADKARRMTDSATWRSANWHGPGQVASATLLELQAIVTDHFRQRAKDVADELEGCEADEVIDGVSRQHEQLDLFWKAVAFRLAELQRAAGGGIDQSCEVPNAAWLAILSPFFEDHILGAKPEDTVDLLAAWRAKAGAHGGMI